MRAVPRMDTSTRLTAKYRNVNVFLDIVSPTEVLDWRDAIALGAEGLGEPKAATNGA